jgi:hypothetical protein
MVKVTDNTFTEDELHLLDKGLKCNLCSKPKTCIKTLALEADTAIRTLPDENQACMKELVANNIQILINNKKRNKTKYREREHAEWRTIKNIK